MKKLALLMSVALSATALAQDDRAQEARGDTNKIRFTLPFKRALAKAKKENRLLFVKPIFGGVDEEGAKDYRCGSW